jgi:hypothetical protein
MKTALVLGRALLLAATTAFLLGAGQAPAQVGKMIPDLLGDRPRFVVVLVDLSGSIPEPDWAIYRQTYVSMVESLRRGDRMVLGTIGDAVMTRFVSTADREYPNSGYLLKDMAQARSNDAFLVAEFDKLRQRKQEQRTEILDSMVIVRQLLDSDKDRRPVILLLSDMLEDSSTSRFEVVTLTDAAIVQLIGVLRKRNTFPSFKSSAVFVAGAKAPNAAKAAEVERFWRRYFEESGVAAADIVYSRPALRFTKADRR